MQTMFAALVVTALVQGIPPAPPVPPARRAPMVIARPDVESALPQAQLRLQAAEPPLAAIEARLEVESSAALFQAQMALAAGEPQLAALEAHLDALAPSAALLEALVPGFDRGVDQQDPTDSLYRAARRALNRSRYADAITLFRQIHETYPRSTNAGDALYWESYALYRIGDTQGLRQA